jgi:hypothetical protein
MLSQQRNSSGDRPPRIGLRVFKFFRPIP